MNKTLKRVLICLAVVIAIVLVVGLVYGIMLNNAKKAVNSAIDTAFTSLKSTDDSTKRTELFSQIGGEEQEQNSQLEDSFDSSVIFSKLEYNIVEEKIGLKEADVTLDITNKDMHTVFVNYIAQAFKLAFANAFTTGYTEDQMNNDLNSYLESQINSDEVENITTSVKIHMVKQDDGWHLDGTNNQEIIDAILPNFVETLNSISNSLNTSNDVEGQS